MQLRSYSIPFFLGPFTAISSLRFVEASLVCALTNCTRLMVVKSIEKKIYMESSPITPLISPMLFTRIYRRFFGALDWQECGIKVYGEYPNNLRFDDIAFMSNSGDGAR